MARFTEQPFGDRLVGKVDPLTAPQAQEVLAQAERHEDRMDALAAAEAEHARTNSDRVAALRTRQTARKAAGDEARERRRSAHEAASKAADLADEAKREQPPMDAAKALEALQRFADALSPARPAEDRKQLTAAVAHLTGSKPKRSTSKAKSEAAASSAVTVDTAVLTKVEGMVASAVARADETHKAELAGLRSELSRLRDQPVAGGPVRIRVGRDRARSGALDVRSLLAQADEYDAKADAADDHTLAQGYRAIARDLRTKAGR